VSAISQSAAVGIKNLGVTFGHRRILEQIDFEVERGEIVAIMGPSGVGKSSLLNCVAGLIRSYDGTVTVLGKAPTDALLNQEIGYVAQKPALIPWLTAQENVELPLQVGSVKRRDAAAGLAEQAMRKMAIWDAREKLPHELSGGMQARVSLARALVREPPLLLLDEAFSGLDDMTKEALHLQLQGAISGRATAIVVTHNLIEAITLADRVLVIDMPEEGCPARLLAVFDSHFPRPRDASILSAPGFDRLHAQIRSVLRREHVSP